MGPLSFISPRVFTLVCICLFAVGARCQTRATSAPLLLPTNIAVDAQGNLYIAETGRHIVHRIDTTGQMTTVAGTGTQGFDGDGGAATAALLDSPLGLAAGNGSLFIADSHNHRVRRVDLGSGIISTYAGSMNIGSAGDGGSAAAAALDLPSSLALDQAGNLYIADRRAHRVRRVAANGLMTTVAGTDAQGFAGNGQTAVAALLDSPGGLAVDSAGNLYIADSHNHSVRRVDAATGVITMLAGARGRKASEAMAGSPRQRNWLCREVWLSTRRETSTSLTLRSSRPTYRRCYGSYHDGCG